MNVLAINSGGSSLKFKVIEFNEPPKADARPISFPLFLRSVYTLFLVGGVKKLLKPELL